MTRKRFEEALSMMQEIEARGPLTPFMRVAYAGVLWALAGQSFREGRAEAGPPFCASAEKMLKPVLSDSRWGEWADRAITMIVLGKAWLQSQVQAETGFSDYRRALARAEQTQRERPGSRNELKVADITVRFSADLLRVGQRTESRQLNAISAAQLRELVSREPALLAARAALGRAHTNHAAEARLQWKFVECRAAIAAGISEFLQVAKADPTTWGYHGNVAALWSADDGAGLFHQDWLTGDFAAAEAALRKGIEIWLQPWADRQSRSVFVNARFDYARLCAATGRDDEATRQLAEAENLRTRIHAERPWLTAAQRDTDWANDERSRRAVEFQRLNWTAVRASSEQVLKWCHGAALGERELASIRRDAQRDLMFATFHQSDYSSARAALDGSKPDPSPLGHAELQDRFEFLRDLLWRVHVQARAGDITLARSELARQWPEVMDVSAAGPNYLFNQVQFARALSSRAEIDGDVAAKRECLTRAAGYLRPAADAGRLTRYEREVILVGIEKQLAALGLSQKP